MVAASAFVLIALLESWRQPTNPDPSRQRWVTNLGLFAIEQVLALTSAGLLAGYVAFAAGRSPLTRWTDAWPGWVVLVFAVVVLDAASYLSHVLSHHIKPLWRLHAVHHGDHALDVTTTVRHHPLELVPTVMALGLCAGLFGLTVVHLTFYGTLAFVVQLIAHANLRLPRQAMRRVGLVLVTPELHALHHSRRPAETNSNYGTVFSVWDRMFGTLWLRTGSEPLEFGLDTYATARFRGLLGALTQPFTRPDVRPVD